VKDMPLRCLVLKWAAAVIGVWPLLPVEAKPSLNVSGEIPFYKQEFFK
jgi:hypothetical protein